MLRRLSFAILLLLAFSLLSAGDYIIGTDTTTENYVPLYGYVNYNWSKFFFSASEMQAAGFTTTQEITRIAFYVNNSLGEYVTDNQRVYMAHFYNNEYFNNTVLPRNCWIHQCLQRFGKLDGAGVG